MLKKLRVKFVCFMMLIVTLMLCVIFGMVYYFTSQSLEEQSQQTIQQIAENPFQLGSLSELQEVRLPDFALQINQYGEVLATSGGYFDLSDETFLMNVIEETLASGEESGILKEYHLRFCRIVTPRSQSLVFVDISSELATLRNLVKTCIFIGALSLLAFFGISLLLAHIAVKPVDKAWAQQRQCVADASHELKTPLTVILTNAELLQDPAYDAQAKAQFSDSILTMSRQMRGLVESLLELARVDNGTMNRAFGPVDFSQLVEESVLPFEPLYFEKGLELQCRAEGRIPVRGSASHLRQVVAILLDNAMKYSAVPAVVTITLKRQGSHCLLAVSNPGEEIPPEDLKNIFKRFYRMDKARSMNHSYGLGLSIAESIVREHRGRIWAQSTQGENTFFVQLPAGS